MQIQDREYQNVLIKKVFKAWREYRSVFLQSSGGSGKTVIFTKITKQVLETPNTRVLILAHISELISQAESKVKAIINSEVGILKAGVTPNPDARIQIGSIQSMKNILPVMSKNAFDVIIIDEAHRACCESYIRVINYFSEAKILGVSATPIVSGDKDLSEYFDTLICGPQPEELESKGFLSSFKLLATVDHMNTEGVKLSAGDYDANEISRANPAQPLAESIVKTYIDELYGKQTIVFACSVEHSKTIAAEFMRNGITCMHLDGTTHSTIRDRIVDLFKIKQIKVLLNVNLFAEGFDVPNLEAVQIALPTKSLAKWIQMAIRVMRPFPGKKEGICIDHTNNFQKLGYPPANRAWYLTNVKEDERPYEYLTKSNGIITMRPKKVNAPRIDPNEVSVVEVTEASLKNVLISSIKDKAIKAAYGDLVKADRTKFNPKDWAAAAKTVENYRQVKNFKKTYAAFELCNLDAPLYAVNILGNLQKQPKEWGPKFYKIGQINAARKKAIIAKAKAQKAALAASPGQRNILYV